jgi:hypothetical protein
MKNPARLVLDKLPKLKTSFAKLSKSDVLVGVPQEEAPRKDVEDKQLMNNATLAFIHDRGSPAANIPARPFMVPGIQNAKPGIVIQFKKAAQNCLHANDGEIGAALTKAGMIAQSSIRSVINAGIAPPLADSTLRARIRSGKAVKGAKAELASRAEGNAPGMDLAKPLVQTGQLRNSINFVIRKK